MLSAKPENEAEISVTVLYSTVVGVNGWQQFCPAEAFSVALGAP
jgi:hypothetical protein